MGAAPPWVSDGDTNARELFQTACRMRHSAFQAAGRAEEAEREEEGKEGQGEEDKEEEEAEQGEQVETCSWLGPNVTWGCSAAWWSVPFPGWHDSSPSLQDSPNKH